MMRESTGKEMFPEDPSIWGYPDMEFLSDCTPRVVRMLSTQMEGLGSMLQGTIALCPSEGRVWKREVRDGWKIARAEWDADDEVMYAVWYSPEYTDTPCKESKKKEDVPDFLL